MSDDIEKLLQSFEGPDPPREVRPAMMAVARAQAKINAKAAARRARSSLIRRWMAVAAAVAAVVVAGLALRPQPKEPQPEPPSVVRDGTGAIGSVESDSLAAHRDGKMIQLKNGDKLYAEDKLRPENRSDVRLSDGSLARIDGGSELTLQKPDPGERVHLRLATGRVFLRAAKAQGEFIVAASARVRALGTTFGVSELDGTTSVNVIDGKVALESGGKRIELERGQSGAATEGTAPELTSDNPNQALRWARDPVRFKDRPLGEVLDWLSRNSSFRFSAPPAVRQMRVSVVISDEPMLEIIDAMMLTCNLTRDVQGNDITIRK
ncbi:MAG: FecR domain-containing protein [Planctomycetes bacterium]|nr:FecR domain-containing protein [Planctomycetota bacterium]